MEGGGRRESRCVGIGPSVTPIVGDWWTFIPGWTTGCTFSSHIKRIRSPTYELYLFNATFNIQQLYNGQANVHYRPATDSHPFFLRPREGASLGPTNAIKAKMAPFLLLPPFSFHLSPGSSLLSFSLWSMPVLQISRRKGGSRIRSRKSCKTALSSPSSLAKTTTLSSSLEDLPSLSGRKRWQIFRPCGRTWLWGPWIRSTGTTTCAIFHSSASPRLGPRRIPWQDSRPLMVRGPGTGPFWRWRWRIPRTSRRAARRCSPSPRTTTWTSPPTQPSARPPPRSPRLEKKDPFSSMKLLSLLCPNGPSPSLRTCRLR